MNQAGPERERLTGAKNYWTGLACLFMDKSFRFLRNSFRWIQANDLTRASYGANVNAIVVAEGLRRAGRDSRRSTLHAAMQV